MTNHYKWPEMPYKGLSYYGPEDIALFAGRKLDIRTCSKVLASPKTRILLLHGKTGCGKSSFLRAGLIPALEIDGVGIEFLKQGQLGSPAIFIRCTDSPLERLASRLYLFIKKGYVVKTPKGTMDIDLSEALQGETSRVDFMKRSLEDAFLLKSIQLLSGKLPRTLMLILDQAEEVLTLSPRVTKNEKVRAFFHFLQDFSAAPVDIKLVISLRTEYYGRFYNAMQVNFAARGDAQQFFLEDLLQKNLEEAIERPTLKSQVQEYGVPYEHYQFEYEPGLVKKIAADLFEAKQKGGVLPVMQIVCNSLYQEIKLMEERDLITHDDYKKLGRVTGRIEEHIIQVIREECMNQELPEHQVDDEVGRWMSTLVKLSGGQDDGTVTTEVISKDQFMVIATQEEVCLDIPRMLAHLADPRNLILRPMEILIAATGKRVSSYSQGHDVIGLTLNEWQTRFGEEKRRRSVEKEFKSFRKFMMTASIVVFFVMVGIFFGQIWRNSIENDTQTKTEVNRFVKQAEAISKKDRQLGLLLAIEAGKRLDSSNLETGEKDPRKTLINILTFSPQYIYETDQRSRLQQIIDQNILISGGSTSKSIKVNLETGERTNYSGFKFPRYIYRMWITDTESEPSFIDFMSESIKIGIKGKSELIRFDDFFDYLKKNTKWRYRFKYNNDEFSSRFSIVGKNYLSYSSLNKNDYYFASFLHDPKHPQKPFTLIFQKQLKGGLSSGARMGNQSIVYLWRKSKQFLDMDIIDLSDKEKNYSLKSPLPDQQEDEKGTSHIFRVKYLKMRSAPDDSAFGLVLDKKLKIYINGEKTCISFEPKLSPKDTFCIGSAIEDLRVAIYKENRGIIIYDSLGEPMFKPFLVPGRPLQMSFTHENKFFLALYKGQVLVWELGNSIQEIKERLGNLSNEKLRSAACKKVDRDMTDDEWARFIGGKKKGKICDLSTKKK